MAQYRQSGTDRFVARANHDSHQLHYANGGASSSDHVAIGIRAAGAAASQQGKAGRWRRSARPEKSRRVAVGSFVLVLALVLFATIFAIYYISVYSNSDENDKGFNNNRKQNDDSMNDGDFLTNVTRTDPSTILSFGHDSLAQGRDFGNWDRDDRTRENSVDVDQASLEPKDRSRSSRHGSTKDSEWRGVGYYNEAGRNELKKYEEEYQASLEIDGEPRDTHGQHHEAADNDTNYEDAIDSHDILAEEEDNDPERDEDYSEVDETKKYADSSRTATKNQMSVKDDKETEAKQSQEESYLSTNSRKPKKTSRSITKKKPKRRKFSSAYCEMRLNSSSRVIEPIETRKFARFSLNYIETEKKPDGDEQWTPRFAGHQTLLERKESFLVGDSKMHCGFVKGPKELPSTGFDLAEDDANYISSCHIAVISCIFGDSDRLRSPVGKTVTSSSRNKVCFVMFVDEMTLQTLSSEGQLPDAAGFVGLWKIVVVKNLPYSDMRRVGKIPKLLPHRLFPSARYSIWLDSKLRLQLDPLLILEYFLWRKGHEYAISNHYDRHCVWDEVAQNKKLNKYNHTVIDEQFAFYKADGLTRFDESNPKKLLPSNVPEGSFIVREHTPMSNLFSCLWFNEVERFTPRDQLSFAYTYQKLRRMNPEKPFYLNMFKDCERRKIAKLYRHRSEEEKRIIQQQAIE